MYVFFSHVVTANQSSHGWTISEKILLFFCCKGGIVHKALFGSPPLNVSKRGVPCDLKSWRYVRKVDTCLVFFFSFWLSSKLISVRAFSSPLRRSVSVANLSQGWFHARRHELKSIRTMKLQQNTCITLLKTIAWIFFPQALPRVRPPLCTRRRAETVWKLRQHVSPSFGLSISIKANSVSYQLFNSLRHMVSLNPICSH